MGKKTFGEMMAEFFEKYNAKDFNGALEFLNQEAPNFPERAALITYNQACMLGAQNRGPEALAVLHTAVDQGYCYQETTIRNDVDFTSLQGNAEFEALVSHFQAAYDAKQADTHTSRLTVEPKPGTAKPYPLLLALHGNGSNADTTLKYWKPAADAGWLVGVLQSSQLGFTASDLVWNDEARSLGDVKQHKTELEQAYAVDKQQVVIGGFSAGGRIAALLGLTQPFPVQGFIGVGPFLAGKLDEWQALLPTVAERGTRVYLIVGDQDGPDLYKDTLRFAEMLKVANIPCELKVYPGMGNAYPSDFDTVLVEALDFIAERKPVAAK